MIFLIFFFIQAHLGLSSLEVKMINGASQIEVYSDKKPAKFFDYNGQNSFSCQVPDVFREKEEVIQKNFLLVNRDLSNTYDIQLNKIITDKNIASPQFLQSFPQTIYPGSSITLTMNYNCMDLSDNSDLFYTKVDIVFQALNPSTLQVVESLEFSYVKLCQNKGELYYKFDYGLVIVVFLVAVIVVLANRLARIMSNKKKFPSVNMNFVKSFAYFILLVPLVILLNYVQTAFIIIYKILISFFSFFAFVFVLNQLLSNLFIRSKLYRPICSLPKLKLQINFFMILGSLIGLAIIIPWGITNNWILSDVIAIFILITVINLVKVRKLKNCLFFMVIQILADILWMLLFNYVFNKDFNDTQQYSEDKQYNDFFGSKLTLPLKIECFYLNPQYNLNTKCSWMGISNLIVPSLLISYVNRYDDYANASIYTIISFFAFFVSLFIWTIVQAHIDISVPFSVYCYPIMMVFIVILAFKRNENYDIWNGLFPDMGLEEPIIKSQDLVDESRAKGINSNKANAESRNVERGDMLNFEENSFPEGKSVSLSMKQALL